MISLIKNNVLSIKGFKILTALFLLCFILQPLTKVELLNFAEFRITAILKLFLLAFFIFVCLLKKSNKQVLLLLLIFTIIFFIGQLIFLKSNNLNIERLRFFFLEGNVYGWIKHSYIFFVVAAISRLKNKKHIINTLCQAFNIIIVINTVCIVIGYVFSIGFFKSYPTYSIRFGYSGLLNPTAEVMYFYIFALCFGYYQYLQKAKVFYLIVAIIGAILVGKKAIFLFLLLLVLIHLWTLKYKKVLLIVVLGLICLSIFIVPISNYLINLSVFWKDVYSEIGLISTLFSKRDILLLDAINHIKINWGFLSYLFGSVEYYKIRSEFGFFDLFLNYGILGLITYMLFLKKIFIDNSPTILKLLLLAVFVIEFFSGGLFSNVLPMIIFYLFTEYVILNGTKHLL